MNPEIFAEWLRRQGHRVVRTQSSYWFDQGPRVFQAFPYHWVIEPTEDELMEFLWREKAIGLRYSTPLKAEKGACSYHIVYQGPAYDLKDVHATTRACVRKGLEACTVRPIPLDRYALEGWEIERDTQDRQQRDSRLGKAQWEMMMRIASRLEGFEVWGAEVDGRLAAALLFVQIDECINLLLQQSRREFLPLRVNNTLLYSVTQALLKRPGVRMIHYGLHSLDAPPTVDRFKIRMGYQAIPLRQRVVFHPWIAPFMGGVTWAVLKQMAKLFPRSEFIRKGEGLTRFYCHGKLPLDRQPFPENLMQDRDSICAAAGSSLHPDFTSTGGVGGP